MNYILDRFSYIQCSLTLHLASNSVCFSPPRSSLMQFQAARGARNYVPQKIETRGEKKTQLRLFNGMVLARQTGTVLTRQNKVSVEFDQYMG